MDNKIQIIRAYWGESETAKNDIFPMPVFSKETVYVWGTANEKMLKERGFNTVKMSEYPTDPRYSTIHHHFYHKLKAIVQAETEFTELIFLDWDAYLARPLDDEFYDRLRRGGEVQVPVYSFVDAPYVGVPERIAHPINRRNNTKLEENALKFIKAHENQLRKYHWPVDGMLATPNFGFYYSRRPGTAKELLNLALQHNVTNCVEEHAMFLWANCTLDEYLDRYEPLVMRGADDSTWMERQFFNDQNDDVVYKINKYIKQRVDKKIYFRHI